MSLKKVYAIIVAGGNGSRMNAELPKQFISLSGKPLIIHTLDAFHKADPHIHFIIVLPEAHMISGKELLHNFGYSSRIEFVAGGETRFHSVKNGLSLVPDNSIVLVHDAVRCMLTPGLIQRCIAQVEIKQSAIPVIMSRDSIRQITPSGSRNLQRQEIRIVQTPQAFDAQLLKDAFRLEYQESFTDEASVVQHAGHDIELIEGEEENIKITFPMDLFMAERLFNQRSGSN